MAANETAAKAQADVTTAELQKQIAALKNDISELTQTVSRYGKAQSDSLKAQARDGLRVVGERGQHQLDAAGEYAGMKYAETEDYIRENPAAAVGIAAGIGFLVGLLTSRR